MMYCPDDHELRKAAPTTGLAEVPKCHNKQGHCDMPV